MDAEDDALIVRLAEPDESELVLAITRAAFEEYRSQPLPSSALRETIHDVRQFMQTGRAVLAFLGDHPVGCARFRVEGACLAFSRMSVIPGARRRGIGRALVGYLEAHARRSGAERVELTARSEQPDNRPYYEGLGYVVVGYSERYGLAKLVTHMRKSLA